MIFLGSYWSMNDVYAEVLLRLLTDGDIVSPRGRQTRELRPGGFTLLDPHCSVITSKARNLNQAFAAAEFCWIMAGDDRLRPLASFNKNMAPYADIGRTQEPRFFGAYGPMVVSQLPNVIATLERDRDSRQAVISIWRPNPPVTRDVPCTLTLQFLVRHDLVELVTVMRSNDVMLGLPYDVQTFTRIQIFVASQLGLEVGSYHHLVGSLHLYTDDVPKAEKILDEYRRTPPLAPARLEDFEPTIDPAALWQDVQRGVIPATWDFISGWGPLAEVMRAYLIKKEALNAATQTP